MVKKYKKKKSNNNNIAIDNWSKELTAAKKELLIPINMKNCSLSALLHLRLIYNNHYKNEWGKTKICKKIAEWINCTFEAPKHGKWLEWKPILQGYEELNTKNQPKIPHYHLRAKSSNYVESVSLQGILFDAVIKQFPTCKDCAEQCTTLFDDTIFTLFSNINDIEHKDFDNYEQGIRDQYRETTEMMTYLQRRRNMPGPICFKCCGTEMTLLKSELNIFDLSFHNISKKWENTSLSVNLNFITSVDNRIQARFRINGPSRTNYDKLCLLVNTSGLKWIISRLGKFHDEYWKIYSKLSICVIVFDKVPAFQTSIKNLAMIYVIDRYKYIYDNNNNYDSVLRKCECEALLKIIGIIFNQREGMQNCILKMEESILKMEEKHLIPLYFVASTLKLCTSGINYGNITQYDEFTKKIDEVFNSISLFFKENPQLLLTLHLDNYIPTNETSFSQKFG